MTVKGKLKSENHLSFQVSFEAAAAESATREGGTCRRRAEQVADTAPFFLFLRGLLPAGGKVHRQPAGVAA